MSAPIAGSASSTAPGLPPDAASVHEATWSIIGSVCDVPCAIGTDSGRASNHERRGRMCIGGLRAEISAGAACPR